MKINIPLLFHFNQHLNEFALTASKACYIGLLKTLIQAPTVANIHISGTLIQALKWLDQEPLDLIRTGIRMGKFEIIGSTHAQNIPYATNDQDNAAQIALHREIIEETFGVRPNTFWNPERCWRQSLVPVIVNGGYRLVTIEDHILEASGADDARVYSTGKKGQRLNVVRDDERLKHHFNFSAWFGETEKLKRYLDSKINQTGTEVQYLSYAEDAEAMGLWGYKHGIISANTWDNLAQLLTEVHENPAVDTVHFSEIPNGTTHLDHINEGSAAWMDASLNHAGRPYHESGFNNWFDYEKNAKKVKYFKAYYDRQRDVLNHFQPENDGEDLLLKLANHAYLTHQYEFGCIGIGGIKSRTWRGAEVVQALLKLGVQQSNISVEELEIENDTVQLMNYPAGAVLLTKKGGRVLYWYSRHRHKLLVGNPSAVVSGEFNGIGTAPEQTQYPPIRQTHGTDYKNSLIHEKPPTRMSHFLPDWIWEEHQRPVTIAVHSKKESEPLTQARPAQQGAFFEEIQINGKIVFDKNTQMHWKGSAYQADDLKSLTITKICIPLKDRLRMHYRLNAKEGNRLIFKIFAELTGDYAAILKHGRRAIDFIPGAGIRINRSGETLQLNSAVHPQEIFHLEGMLCLVVGFGFELNLEKGETKEFDIDLVHNGTGS